jgi:hypothetical protein
MKIDKGDVVVAVLRDPREKVLGIVEEISDAGIYLRGIDLNYFDEWTMAIRNDEPYLPMQDLFYPLWRLERVSRDEEAAGVPSMADQFEQRTGLRLSDA